MKLVSYGRLKNGIMYYSQYDPTSNVSGIGVRRGSIHDPPDRRGKFHLIEHVICRSSKKYDNRKVDLILEEFMGGPDADINIRIDRTSTFFGHDNLLYRNHVIKCFDMLASLFLDRLVDREGLEVEKAAILQEYYLYGVDVMYNLVGDLMHKVMHDDNNPVRNRIDCEPGELEKITLAEVKQDIKRGYSTENTFVILLGPKFTEAKAMTEKYFGHLPRTSAPVLDHDFSKKFHGLSCARSIIHEQPGIHQSHLAIGFPTGKFMTGDDAAIEILARIWAFRLRMRLREGNINFREGVYRTLVYSPRSFAHGMIYSWLAVNPSFVSRAEEIVLDECDKLKKDQVVNGEFNAIKNSIRNIYRDAFLKSPGALSELIIQSTCNGDEELVHLHSFLDRWAKVTPRKLREVANKYFTIPNYARVLIRPT